MSRHASIHRSRPGGLGPVLSSLLLLTSLLVGLAGAGPAQAASVPRSACARYETGIRTGVCVRNHHGDVFWLGTLAGYGGREVYCLDYGFGTNWGISRTWQTVSSALATSLGATVGPPTVAALNYLVSRYPATSANATTAAAIELVVREVMGDARLGGRGIPGGLTAVTAVKDVAFVPGGLVARAKQLWGEAVQHRGPWVLHLAIDSDPSGHVKIGRPVTAVVTARNGSGGPQDLTVDLTYAGLSGPKSVRLGSDGAATVQLPAPVAAGIASVSAVAAGTPSARLVIGVPVRWERNRHPGRPTTVNQRGLLATAATTAVSAAARVTVVKRQPALATQASAQRVVSGVRIHDSVTVSGTGSDAGSFTWWLIGPVSTAASGRCPGVGDVAWNSAPVLATGHVATTGDGVVRTPDYLVRPQDVGCLTYVESRPGTLSTLPTSTSPGVPTETVLVDQPLATPCVTTTASRQTGLVGSSLVDRIAVGCVGTVDRVAITWTLHGPVRPRAGVAGKAGCDGITAVTWARAPIAARGSLTQIGPGHATTPSYVVRRPGCYTYSESAAASATTKATSTAPGVAVETAMITRPGRGTPPLVPTGYRGAFVPGSGTVRIPSLHVAAPVSPVDVVGSTMAIPGDPGRLGWLTGTAQPDDVIGAAVIAGHISDRYDRPGALARLGSIKRGARILWIDAAGRSHRYAVTSVARYSRGRPLPAAVFRTDGAPVLRLITCAHRVRQGRGFHYADNLVVTAAAVS